MLKAIDVNKIDPSPFQIRQYRDEGKLKELGASIEREGQIEPIVVRLNGGSRYELIVGHRRVEAVREYTKMNTILALIIEVDDLQARRISAAENLQREDLSAIETIALTLNKSIPPFAHKNSPPDILHFSDMPS